VSGADAKLFNNATLVVLMREGTRTVLSMQNNYQGPPESFAMVIPVPVVLQEDNVKTLSDEVFSRVDQLAAPRLVEYWEQDPCYVEPDYEMEFAKDGMAAPTAVEYAAEEDADLGVTIEAQFTVGEYEIAILSAKDSTGLDTWLRREEYTLPEGAEPLLRPYVEEGMKFFVAKVDITKVKVDPNGKTMLSPLRFHYDTEEFRLPVRLGLINSSGKQDLLVHILARGKRYELANYDNVTIPTNLDVAPEARERFGELYAALFDATLGKNPKAIVTEYSWDSSSCDPCPTPPLRADEIATLGGDVLGGELDPWGGGFVLTRLHARYDKESLGEDLVFREAPAIVGGREFMMGDKLEKGSRPAGTNNFQARYAMRHPWEGPITCKDPIRGRWGGPPAGGQPKTEPAKDLAFAERGSIELKEIIREDVPEIGVMTAAKPVETKAIVDGQDPSAEPKPAATAPADAGPPKGSASSQVRAACSCSAEDGDRDTGVLGLLSLLGLLGLRRRR
jgi:MYXO-CTERM domain-containing protein